MLPRRVASPFADFYYSVPGEKPWVPSGKHFGEFLPAGYPAIRLSGYPAILQ